MGNKNRSGFGALKEIRRYQKIKNLLIQKKSFVRLLREIAENCPWSAFNSTSEWDFEPEAMKVLQFGWEDFLTELDEDTDLCTIRAKCVIFQPNDLRLAVKLCRDEEKMHTNVKWANWTEIACAVVSLVAYVAIKIEDSFIIRLYPKVNRASNC